MSTNWANGSIGQNHFGRKTRFRSDAQNSLSGVAGKRNSFNKIFCDNYLFIRIEKYIHCMKNDSNIHKNKFLLIFKHQRRGIGIQKLDK